MVDLHGQQERFLGELWLVAQLLMQRRPSSGTTLASKSSIRRSRLLCSVRLIATEFFDVPYPAEDGRRAWFQEGDFTGPLQTKIQILETTNTTSVTTDAALKAIIMKDQGSAGHELDVYDNGGKHDEIIAMGQGGDTLKLFDQGNDAVYGGKGNDSIDASGSTGNDSLVGGGGNDTIRGGSGYDTLVGGSGKDELHSGSTTGGHNLLYAGSGAETLYGGGGADSLYGGSGHNSLVAGTGQHQLLQAGSGNTVLVDTLAASGGTDTLIGGAGNDTIKGQQGDILQDTGAVRTTSSGCTRAAMATQRCRAGRATIPSTSTQTAGTIRSLAVAVTTPSISINGPSATSRTFRCKALAPAISHTRSCSTAVSTSASVASPISTSPTAWISSCHNH